MRRPSASVNSSTIVARRAPLAGQRLERRDVDLDVEVAGVADDGAVLHRLEVLARGARRLLPVTVQKMSPIRAASAIGMTWKPSMRRLERPQRVDLGHDDRRAHAARAHREALAAPAVAGDTKTRPASRSWSPARCRRASTGPVP